MRLPDIKTFASIIILILCANSLSAHDYWLEPELFVFPDSGRSSAIHLHMGSRFTSEQERPLQLARTSRFMLYVSGEAEDLTVGLEDGRLPIMQFTPQRDGTHLFAMERTRQRIELAAAEFNSYLREEGLEDTLSKRRTSGRLRSAGRERYTRYIKALVQVGELRTKDYARIVGQRLEIVPLRNPYQMKSGETLPVQILFDGKPLVASHVAAYNRVNKISLAARTDKTGIARFRLHGSGAWLIRLVHMRACAECEDADWESFWGACTFAVN